MPRGFGTSRGRKSVYFSIGSPLDQNPDPKYKPCPHLKKHHDFVFVIDLAAAQNSLEFYQHGDRECFMLRHSSSRVPHQDHQL